MLVNPAPVVDTCQARALQPEACTLSLMPNQDGEHEQPGGRTARAIAPVSGRWGVVFGDRLSLPRRIHAPLV
jgi:hypothetical protein